MKKLIFIIFISAALAEMFGQTNCLNDSVKPDHSFAFQNSLNVYTIGEQILGGYVAGSLVFFPFPKTYPIAATISWLAGSSLGVWLVGHFNQLSSSYWGTLLGGTTGSALFLVLFKKNIEGYEDFLLINILASVPLEIISYYLFKTDTESSSDVSVCQRNTYDSYRFINNNAAKPDFSIQIINISF